MAGAEGPLVLVSGRVCLEFFGVVARFPDRDTTTELDEISVQVGGQAGIAAGALASLGCRTRLVCKLADDFQRVFLLDALRDAGVEVCGALDKNSRLSPMGFQVNSRTMTRRLAFKTGGDVPALTATEIDPPALLAGAAALLVDGQEAVAQIRLAEAARKQNLPVICDLTDIGTDSRDLVALCDVLISSERAASALVPRGEPLAMLTGLSELGPQAVIVTQGDKGAVGLHRKTLIEQRAFPTEVVDTAGAGSVFHAAFTAALLSDLPFARCLEFASAAAGLSCRRLGGWAGIATRADVLEFMKKRPAAAAGSAS